jgi:hypothetical protein
MLAAIGMFVLVLVLFIVLASIKKPSPRPSALASISPPPVVMPFQPSPVTASAPVSYREQQLNEFALLLAEEHRRLADETQRASIRESLAVAEEYRKLTEESQRNQLRSNVAAMFAAKPLNQSSF